MSPKGEVLSRTQRRAIVALLSNRSIKDAADEIGISQKTLWRWLRLPHFIDRLRTSQRDAFDSAIHELQAASIQAVRRLIENLDSTNVTASNAAAVAILSNALKGREVFELLQRIERLEALLDDDNSQVKVGPKWA